MARKHRNPDIATPVVAVVSAIAGAAFVYWLLRPSAAPPAVTERQVATSNPTLLGGGVRDDLPTGNGECPPGTAWGWDTGTRGGQARCRPIEPEATP